MDRRFVPIAVALVVSTVVAALAWSVVKLHTSTTIDVRGSARRRINSDLVEWTAVVDAQRPSRAEAYAQLKKDIEQLRTFLHDNKVPDEHIRVQSAAVQELSHEDTIEDGNKVIRKLVSDGWQATQAIRVTSTDVPLIERLSRESTQLIEKGVSISSQEPRYLYTKLGELKIEMLAEAAGDARLRAERLLQAAGGGKIGTVVGIDTGVININAANSTETSWEGNNDTSSFEKDIITTVRVRFDMRD